MADPRIRRSPRVAPGVLPSGVDPVERLTALRDRALNTFENVTVADLTVTGALVHTGSVIALYGDGGAAQGGPFVQNYATADLTLSAYTPDDESVAYTGLAAGLPATPYAAVIDLNALRVAYENLKAFAEDLAQHHNALLDFLQSRGDIG